MMNIKSLDIYGGDSMENKIAFIAPYKKLGEIFNDVADDLNKDIPVYIGDLENGVEKAIELEEQGFEAIISRGGTAIAIRSRVKQIPIIEVEVSGFDLIRSIYQAKLKTNKIAVVGFEPFTAGIKQLGDIMDIKLKVVTIQSGWHDKPTNIKEELYKIKEQNFNWLVGDNIAVKTAKSMGMNPILIRTGREALTQAIKKAEEIVEVKKREKQKAKQQQSIISFAYEGIISIDGSGTINTFNPKAEELLSKKSYQVLGKNIEKVIPEFKLINYLKNQEKKRGEILTINNQKIIANIIPIVVEGISYGCIATFQKVSHLQKMEEKVREELYLKGYTADNTFKDIIGVSQEIKRTIDEAKDYAQVDLPLLIYGETGTGKELYAQSIHNFSHRNNNPFVAFNCASLPEKLIESELFGYVEGAFTGAHKEGRKGLIEQAHGGTLFLDEIGEISLNLQAKLLRFLEERKIRKLGDNKLTPVDVRIILATNKSLEKMVNNNTFREDVYYRINVLNLNLAPLREKKEDIYLLVNFFIKKANQKTNKTVTGISNKGMKVLNEYYWPGNVRQLENVIEKLVVRTKEDIIKYDLVIDTLNSIRIDTRKDITINNEKVLKIPLDNTLQEIEKEVIKQMVKKLGGNKTLAAKKLNIGRTTIWRKLGH